MRAASIVFGVIRARTSERWKSFGVGWGGLVATRLALIAVAAAIGATVAVSPATIPLMLAITLMAQKVTTRMQM